MLHHDTKDFLGELIWAHRPVRVNEKEILRRGMKEETDFSEPKADENATLLLKYIV